MSRKIIAIDIDDVIADTTEALRQTANQIPGVQLTKDHYQAPGEYWGYYEAVWARNNVDHLVSFDTLHTDMATDQSHVKLITGAKTALEKLSKKYRIVLVTSREVEWIETTNKWVMSNLGEYVEDIVFVHHKNTDGRTKGDACLELGASWLIDDNVDHCKSAKQQGVEAILFGSYGWNIDAKEVSGLNKALNWGKVLEYFDGKS